MPYSKSHSYIYIAIPKTGSTSLIRSLKNMHEQEGGDLLLRQKTTYTELRKEYGYRQKLNKKNMRVKHLSALELRSILRSEYDTCFSFTMVRNPWARALSQYHFQHIDFMPEESVLKKREIQRKFTDLDFETWLLNRWTKWKSGKSKYKSQLSRVC